MFLPIIFLLCFPIAFGARNDERKSPPRKTSDAQNMPPFLKNVSPSGRRNFELIVKRDDLTKGEIKENVEDWARRQGEEIVTALKDFEEDRKKNISSKKEGIAKTLEELPKILEKYDAIKGDETITKRDERAKINDLYSHSDPRHAAVLRCIFEQFKGKGKVN